MAQKAFNSIFGKVGRVASEEVIVQLLKSVYLSYTHGRVSIEP